VSYAWSGSFGETINALNNHFKDKEDPFLWMDVAIVDQHTAAESNPDFSEWARDSLKVC